MISPYARRHYIDHQQLSFDAFAKFIEDDFLHGQRLNPKTDGRPDPRPDVRENARGLGNLRGRLQLQPEAASAGDPPDPPDDEAPMSIEPTPEQFAALAASEDDGPSRC